MERSCGVLATEIDQSAAEAWTESWRSDQRRLVSTERVAVELSAASVLNDFSLFGSTKGFTLRVVHRLEFFFRGRPCRVVCSM